MLIALYQAANMYFPDSNKLDQPYRILENREELFSHSEVATSWMWQLLQAIDAMMDMPIMAHVAIPYRARKFLPDYWGVKVLFTTLPKNYRKGSLPKVVNEQGDRLVQKLLALRCVGKEISCDPIKPAEYWEEFLRTALLAERDRVFKQTEDEIQKAQSLRSLYKVIK
ncbi:MAG: hypothetical protein JWN37_534 [Candidatus Nomurabacteria bacterium]|nr:hypothetical protein [Candidatus Nomurabacteria bacterium]